MKYIAIDIETYDKETLKSSLDVHNAEIRLISIATSESAVVVIDKLHQPKAFANAVQQLAAYWRSPDVTWLGTYLTFDFGCLQSHYPDEFDVTYCRSQIVPLDLAVRCFLGHYRKPAEDTPIALPTDPDNNDKHRLPSDSINPYGLSLVGMLRFFECNDFLTTDYVKFKESYQKRDWGQPKLTKADYDYSIFDVKSIVSGLLPKAQALGKRSPKQAVTTFKIEQEFVLTALKMQSYPLKVDLAALEEKISNLKILKAEAETEWYKSNELRPTQTAKLRAKWDLESISKLAYLELSENFEFYDDYLLRIKICSINKILTEAEKLKKSLNEKQETRLIFNPCNGSGRCTTAGKGTPYLNLQAISSRGNVFLDSKASVKSTIVPHKGNVFLDLDVPACHLRLAFALSKDVMGCRFLTEGIDQHSFFAAMLCNDMRGTSHTWQSIKSEVEDGNSDAKALRNMAKEVVFARLNGAGARTITTRASARMFKKVDQEMVATLVRYIDSTHRELTQFRKDLFAWLLDNPQQKIVANQLRHQYTLTKHHAFDDLPVLFKPHLTSMGQFHQTYWEDGQQMIDLHKPLQPKFTQVIASIWARIEALMMKDWLNWARAEYPQYPAVFFHYDSGVFEVPEHEFDYAKFVLAGGLNYRLSSVLMGRLPSGIDDDYMDKIKPKHHL